MPAIPRGLLGRIPWWAATFLLAFGIRLAFLLLADEPLLWAHPYNYFNGGLAIVEHPDPWEFILKSDAWHQWLGPWTIAPLYYLFVAGVFAIFGAHLIPLLVIQYVLDSLVTVGVGALGEAVWERRGRWAGIAYAVNFHAVEQSSSTLTENLHTVLLLGALILIAAEAARPSLRRAAGGGFLLGLSALARSVSLAFVPLIALWRALSRRDLRAGAVLVLTAAAAVVPWTARNVVFIGDFVPVETNGVYNLWDDNAFATGERRARQERTIADQPTLAAQRAQALHYAWRGIVRNPGQFAEKAWRNFVHLLRLEGLHLFLRLEEPQPEWRHAALILFDDTIMAGVLLLFPVFVAAGRPSPARSVIVWWTAYYLFMVVVVFHNEVRYRSTLLPFALAGAAGGWSLLADPTERRRGRTLVGLGVGVALVALVLEPYPGRAWRALRSGWTLRSLEGAVARGDLSEAGRVVLEAASQDREAARPWLVYGRALAHAGHPAEALDAYARAEERKPFLWLPTLVRPRLLRDAGREGEIAPAIEAANELSWRTDSWLTLEAAWRELPPPRTDEVLLARGDYGSARGFTNPRRDHRWSRHRAFLRLVPSVPAAAYDVTLTMGAPPPSTLESPAVEVRVEGGTTARFQVGANVTDYTFRTPAPRGGVFLVVLETPTWSKLGSGADQGVRVDRLRVVRASPK